MDRTPLWMAPELLRGGVSSAASDIYAFGIMLYEVAPTDFYLSILRLSSPQNLLRSCPFPSFYLSAALMPLKGGNKENRSESSHG